MIHHGCKFIFSHIPKTGGSSIEVYFIKMGLFKDKAEKFGGHGSIYQKHNCLWQVQRGLAGENIDFDEYFKFSAVRNPWDRVVSSYFWHYNRKIITESFDDHVKKGKDAHNAGPNNVYYSFLFSKDAQRPLFDFIIRFENLQEDFKTVCKRLSLPGGDLPHKHKTEHKHYTEYYNNETEQLIKERYRRDIEYFGYEFGK